MKGSERREHIKVREKLQMLEGQDLYSTMTIMSIRDISIIMWVIHS